MKRLNYEQNHKEIDGELHKLCSECNKWFPCTDEYFYKNKSSKDGHYPTCIICSRNRAIERRLEKRDYYVEKSKEWYYKNREKELERISRRYEENKEKIQEYGKQYRKTDHGKAIVKKHSKNRYSNKTHNITEEQWLLCKDYFKNANDEYCCAYCGTTEKEHKEKYNQQLHKEHVYDKGSNDIDNCVPSCKECNSKKHTTLLLDWYNENNSIFSQERLDKILKWIIEDYKKTIK